MIPSRVDGEIAMRVAKLILFAKEHGNVIRLDDAGRAVVPRMRRHRRRLAIKRMVSGLKRGGIVIDLIVPTPKQVSVQPTSNVLLLRPTGEKRAELEPLDTRCVCGASKAAHRDGVGPCPAKGCPEYYQRAQ